MKRFSQSLKLMLGGIYLSLVLFLPSAAQNSKPLLRSAKRTNHLKIFKSVEAKIHGFNEAFCTNLPAGLSVCQALADRNESNEAKFLIRRNNRILSQWETEVSIYSDLQDLKVLYGDLDGDGSPEIIVPQLTTESNGLGVRYFSLYILENPLTKGIREPLQIQTQEFGDQGSFVFNRRTKTYDVLITYWAELNLTKIVPGTKSGGTYLVGRWFNYKNGRILLNFDKPVMARRYLNSFEDERLKREIDVRQNYPYSWLRNTGTLQLKIDPEVSPETLSTERGTLINYGVHEIKFKDSDGESRSSFYQKYIIRFDSGKTVEYRFSDSVETDKNITDLELPVINRLGFLPSRLTLPAIMHILDIFDAPGDMENRRVTITTHPSEDGIFPQAVLWFDKN